MFRYLFSLRHLEQQLVANWQTWNKASSWAHKSSDKEIELCKRRAFTLRARMLVYVQQLLYFCTSEVIEPNWQAFMEKLKNGSKSAVGTVDELMQNHVDFLDTCLKECMLTNARLLRVCSMFSLIKADIIATTPFLIFKQRHSKLMQTCTLFSNFTSWFSRELESNDPDLSGNSKPPQLEKMIANLRKFELNFGRHMHVLLDELNHFAATETVVLLSFCARLSDIHQGTEFREPGPKTDDGADI